MVSLLVVLRPFCLVFVSPTLAALLLDLLKFGIEGVKKPLISFLFEEGSKLYGVVLRSEKVGELRETPPRGMLQPVANDTKLRVESLSLKM